MGSCEILLERFAAYLREERGVSMLTVDAYVSDSRRFLSRYGSSDLRAMSAGEVSAVVVGEVVYRSPATVRRFGVSVRAFLRYCHVAGLVEHDLSELS
jgi:integrase/recombinase XerD